MSEEMRGYKIPEEAVKNFGVRIAKAFNKNCSSTVYFLLQQAFPEYADDWEWSDFKELLDKVLSNPESKEKIKK